MTQQERYKSRTEEEPVVNEETTRNMGNQALTKAAEQTDEVLDRLDEVLDEDLDSILDEFTDLTDDQALEQINNFKQKNGQ